MLDNKKYKNGNDVYQIKDNILTYYFKDGTVKAKGHFIDNLMEGEWLFYRQGGQLWQIGNFKNNKKNGYWRRYDKNDKLEYQEEFVDGKLIKK